MYFLYAEFSPPFNFLKNGKTLSLTCSSICSAGISVHLDHLQSSFPLKIEVCFSPNSLAFCSLDTSSSSNLFMKIKYDICSIACNGLLIPPLQNLFQSKFIFDFRFESSILLSHFFLFFHFL